MKIMIIRAGAMGVALMMLLATPGVAQAQEAEPARPPDAATDEVKPTGRVSDRHDRACAAAKERALQAIHDRLAALGRLREAVAANEHLTPAHEAQLQAELATAQRALTQQAAAIREATCRELPEVIRQLVDDHRIFALLVPKVHLVIGADTILQVVNRFEDVAGWLEEVISRFEAAGHEVSAAQAELDEMKVELAAAFELAEPIPGMVLPLRPSDLPGATSIIEEAARMLKAAGAETRAAWMSVHEVMKALRQIKNG